MIKELSIRRRVHTFLIRWGQTTRVKNCYVDLSAWVLVCNNMCPFERHFGSFCRDPTIIETVSFASQWVNLILIEMLFLLKYNDWEHFQHRCVFAKVQSENQI